MDADPLHAVERLALAMRPWRLAAAIGAGILVFGLLGALHFGGAPLGLFDLDGEGKPPALFSAALTGGAGLVAFAVGRHRPGRRWPLLGGLLLFMAADDLLTIHEQLQILTGIDWQLLYLPVVLVLGVLGVATLIELRASAAVTEAWLLAGGAAAWLIAQLCEAVEYEDGSKVLHYGVYATIEETLEMAGSGLFLLAFVLALGRLRRPSVHDAGG